MPLVPAQPKIVSPVQIETPLVNVSLHARKELSVIPILVFHVLPIALPAPDPLPINVQNAPQIVLFTTTDIAIQSVPTKTSTSTLPYRHASLATRLAQAALVLALVVVWHVQTPTKS